MAGVRSVLIPGSITSETADPRVATYKIGLIGRACAAFGVDEAVVYEDPDHKDSRTVSRILAYQATAPYLRKRLFPISDELAHVGVLPPLNLPLHLAPDHAEPNQVRMGTLVGGHVDIGLPALADVQMSRDDTAPEPGQQFPVRVLGVRAGRAAVALHAPGPGEYAGFRVSRAPGLRSALKDRAPILGTSRLGEPLSKKHLSPEGLAVVFGGPDKSVRDLLGEEPRFPLVNTLPEQRTRTVRTEEAVWATLALLHASALGIPTG